MPELPRNSMTGQVTTKLGRVSMNPRGEYQGGETYARLDIVQYNGSGWICLKDETSDIEPVEGENWMRFADNGSATMYEQIQALAEQVQSDKTAADKSATEAAESASQAKAAADTAVSDAEAQLQKYVDAAETAQTGAQNAQTAAETARDEAKTASTSASEKATEASQSAETAKQYSGNPPIIGEDDNWQTWDAEAGEYTSTDKPSRGEVGPQGEPGVSPSVSVEKQGKTTTVTITDADGPHEFNIEDGKDGTGAGDMTKYVYDPDGHSTNIFQYVDDVVKNAEVDLPPHLIVGEDSELPTPLPVDADTLESHPADYFASKTEMSTELEKKQDVLPYYTNKNILDNPDFQHPVNQRGQTTYTATGYFIDRWRTNTHTTADNPITLVSKGLQSGKTNLDIYQSIETERIQRDQSYTVSVIVNGELCSRTIGPNEWDVNHVIREQGNVCIRLKETGKNIELDIFCGAGDLIITAAKLELGSQQTLAHKEGDTWVLNEIPNYAEELAKCQRYQQVLSGFDDSAMLGVGFANTINNAQILVSTPVSLRAIPSAKMNGETLYLVDSSSWGAGKIVTAISARRATNNTIMLNCTVQSELTVNKTYFLCTLKNTSLILDANL